MKTFTIGIAIAGVLLLLLAPMLGTYLAGLYLGVDRGNGNSNISAHFRRVHPQYTDTWWPDCGIRALLPKERGKNAMKYTGMPFAVWQFFYSSFEKNLTAFFGISKADAKSTMAKAKEKYKEIIENLPEFEKGDRFQMNIVGCAMLAAVVLSMPERPDVETFTVYYRSSMMTGIMKWFCRMSGKQKFTPKDMDNMKKTAAFRAADRNPYSWNMDFLPYPDGSGYEARFTKCGICTLMQELGLFELVPAMCALDYAMSEAGGASQFVRECTLANGDDYCDCGYKKRVEG